MGTKSAAALRAQTTQAPAARSELAALLRRARPIAPDTPVQHVGERILGGADAEWLSLPIVADGVPVGAISRNELMRIYLMPFGREIYGRRPIATLMNHTPLVVAVDTPIDEAARAIAAHIRSPITEDFIVVDARGRYLGAGSVLDVLHAVEGRLARRGRELERAHVRLKASQTHLVQSEKMASLGQMVAGLVHEINTPLSYLRNNVEMTKSAIGGASRLIAAQERALAGMPIAPECVADLDALRGCIDATMLDDLDALLDDTIHGIGQIGELVANLKDFSRLDQARTDRVDLDALIDAALRIVQHLLRKRDIAIERHRGELPEIVCAPAQINQVLLNLVGNAIQAIEHERGRITIRTQALDRRVMVLIEDNGKGIAAEHLARIFDPFFTTKPVGQGTGLGLSIAHQIVEQHGGLIRVASKPGVGTRFLVALPAAPDPAANTP